MMRLIVLRQLQIPPHGVPARNELVACFSIPIAGHYQQPLSLTKSTTTVLSRHIGDADLENNIHLN